MIRRALLLSDDAPEIRPNDIRFDRPVSAVTSAGTQDSDLSPFLSQTSENAGMAGKGFARLSDIARRSEAKAILETLDQCSGNRGKTAKQLGISERTLRYRMADMREAGMLTSGAGR